MFELTKEENENLRLQNATLRHGAQFLIPPEQSKRRRIGFRRPNEGE
jgi:hypothetical protein